MEHGCDIWLIHAHARCRHVVSQWEQLHRAQKDREAIPQGWQRVVQRARHANQMPGMSRPLSDLSREPINFLISMAQRTAHERQARMAVWCLGEQRQGETQRNKLQAATQALAAQKQYSRHPHEMNCEVAAIRWRWSLRGSVGRCMDGPSRVVWRLVLCRSLAGLLAVKW